jgi:hypothetical protein
MKTIQLVFLFSLISCNDKSTSQSNHNLVTQDSSGKNHQKSYQDLIRLDSIAIVKTNMQMGVTFKSTDLCDDRKGIFLDQGKLRKYGANSAYDLKRTFENDSTYYTFEIITECCHDFMGGIEIKNDTLFLNYLKYNGSCDCDCDYKLNYSFKENERHWKTVRTREIALGFNQ